MNFLSRADRVTYTQSYDIKSDINYVINLRDVNETYPSIYINYHQGVQALTIWHYASRADDRLFFSKCHVKNDAKHTLSSIERLARSQARSFLTKTCTLASNFASRDNELFLDDRSSGDRTSHYDFCVGAEIRWTKRVSRGRAGGASARVYGTDVRFVSECRWAERSRKRPSALGGKPSGATRRGVLSEYSVMLCMAS